MQSNTPLTDKEESRQRSEYEQSREAGDPPFPADFDFARRMEIALRSIATMDYSQAAINGMAFKAVSEAKSALDL